MNIWELERALYQLSARNGELLEQVTALQKRGTELIQENREMKLIMRRMIDDSIVDYEAHEQAAKLLGVEDETDR